MGYAMYETPLGAAGYAVADVCNQDGCSVVIDRGLAYLCGSEPGRQSEHGCGHWFCGHHLYTPFHRDIDIAPGGGLCPTCIENVDDEEDE